MFGEHLCERFGCVRSEILGNFCHQSGACLAFHLLPDHSQRSWRSDQNDTRFRVPDDLFDPLRNIGHEAVFFQLLEVGQFMRPATRRAALKASPRFVGPELRRPQ